ncbi:hypothetical protein COO59_20045 [Mixta theicola]|uniref:AraC-type arabinose-binding/dimerisation domain-containing protein n=1 Tax=Mixta theicola TaxID=1458355 RepID=A0A2K1Q4Q3_9GAMM|nr:AraC family ligand binding domain-containing protein [Mixta theicola]MCQ0603129.1 AraC family ligand binding domain-containing protein [Klebsiella pneumoniae]PNS09947.1 hypothetical protein COO59_20045 [Mixta theicola]GLR08795.1 hypothetical protein GCM10007905_15140 [Mixta theicola]
MEQFFRVLEVHHLSGKNIVNHSHKFGQLAAILQGTMIIKTDKGWWLIPPGLSLWLPAGRQHATSYSEDSHVILIEIEGSRLDQLPAECQPYYSISFAAGIN